MFILAIDLEGTIISNAMSQFPRKHLFSFVEFCKNNFDQIVWFTAVNEILAKKVINNLVVDRYLPEFSLNFPFIKWAINSESESDKLILGKSCFKDLSYVQKMFPNTSLEDILIIDDDIFWIVPEQRKQWIEIEHWDTPYDDDDELLRVEQILLEKKFFKVKQTVLE